jgi:hypothetical protein
MTKAHLAGLCLLALSSAHCWMKPHPAADPQHPLECRLEAAHPRLAGGPVAVRFQLINRTESPVSMLQWNTPFEGWRGTILSVSFDGKELPYQGPMTKRGDPGAQEYVRIRAGESMITALDLSQAYDVSKPGRYTVNVTGDLQDVIRDGAQPPRPRDRFQPLKLSCNELAIDVEKGKGDVKVNY